MLRPAVGFAARQSSSPGGDERGPRKPESVCRTDASGEGPKALPARLFSPPLVATDP
jgi:hypothetical protein